MSRRPLAELNPGSDQDEARLDDLAERDDRLDRFEMMIFGLEAYPPPHDVHPDDEDEGSEADEEEEEDDNEIINTDSDTSVFYSDAEDDFGVSEPEDVAEGDVEEEGEEEKQPDQD